MNEFSGGVLNEYWAPTECYRVGLQGFKDRQECLGMKQCSYPTVSFTKRWHWNVTPLNFIMVWNDLQGIFFAPNLLHSYPRKGPGGWVGPWGPEDLGQVCVQLQTLKAALTFRQQENMADLTPIKSRRRACCLPGLTRAKPIQLVFVLMSIGLLETNSPARSSGEFYSVPNSLFTSCFPSPHVAHSGRRAAAFCGGGGQAAFCVLAGVARWASEPQAPPSISPINW